MIFCLTIDTDNAAFHEAPLDGAGSEIARILGRTAHGIHQGEFDLRQATPVFDLNGNEVGSFVLAGDRPFDWATDEPALDPDTGRAISGWGIDHDRSHPPDPGVQ